MLTHPNFDPVALQLGPIAVRWYGLMYLAAFAIVLVLGRMRIRSQPWLNFTVRDLDDMLFFGVLGVVLGGRLGYILFYKPLEYMHDPVRIFFVWEGGMSFHGGLIGVILAMLWFAHSRGKPWFEVTDFIAPLCPLGLGAGRIGNFINGELWGRPTELPWAMVFPGAGPLPRHPSQIYEACLEGLVLFIVLWWFSARPRPSMAVSGLFLLLYGIFRSMVEFVREPDTNLGYLAGDWLTMGQVLSLPMIVFGLLFLVIAYRKAKPDQT